MKSYYIPLAEIPSPQLKSVFRQRMLCLFTKNLNGKKYNAQSTMEEIPLCISGRNTNRYNHSERQYGNTTQETEKMFTEKTFCNEILFITKCFYGNTDLQRSFFFKRRFIILKI